MSDNPVVSNSSSASNPDITVRATETLNGQIQHFRLDLGSGSSESQASGTVPVSGSVTASEATVSTATLSNVVASASSVQLLASNTSRKMAMIFNDSAQNLYVKFGTTASSSSFSVLLTAYAYYELPTPVYTGRIDGVWASASGNARITELT